jgi:hypothetical protein
MCLRRTLLFGHEQLKPQKKIKFTGTPRLRESQWGDGAGIQTENWNERDHAAESFATAKVKVMSNVTEYTLWLNSEFLNET